MTLFAGSHIWIIGASSGIGRALAMRLAREGAILSLSARNGEALEALRASMQGTHSLYPLDVTHTDLLEAAAAAQSRIDRVIYLAGQYEPGPLADADPAKARAIVETNLMGALNAIQCVLPIMRRQGHGQIVLCGSIAGYRGLPNGQPYSATKAAIINLAESLKVEESKNGIDVRLISPGFIKTALTDKNTFPMPGIISPEQAADDIVEGLKGRQFEIHFPRRMTLVMKLLQMLPYPLFFKLVGRL